MEALLSDWRWLVSGKFEPVLMNVFRDAFMADSAGRLHFLDLMSGGFKVVAKSREEFDLLCEDGEHRLSWFIPHLAMELRKVHGDLAPGKCFSCKIPLALGGQLEVGNFEPADIQVHYSILGQLYQQIQHMPAGTRIRDIHIE